MMPGQHRAGEVVEAPRTRLAAIALPSALRVVTPVSGNREAVTPGTAHAIGPAMLAHQCEALGVVQKTREVNQIGCNHDDEAPRASRTAARASAITSDALRTRYPDPPPRNPIRATGECFAPKPGRNSFDQAPSITPSGQGCAWPSSAWHGSQCAMHWPCLCHPFTVKLRRLV